MRINESIQPSTAPWILSYCNDSNNCVYEQINEQEEKDGKCFFRNQLLKHKKNQIKKREFFMFWRDYEYITWNGCSVWSSKNSFFHAVDDKRKGNNNNNNVRDFDCFMRLNMRRRVCLP